MIDEIELNFDGQIVGAKVTQPNGSWSVYEQGELIQRVQMDGTIVHYAQGLVSQVIDGDGREENYAYVLNAEDQSVEQVYVQSEGELRIYDDRFNLLEHVSLDGVRYIFETTSEGVIENHLAQIRYPDGTVIQSITLGENNEVLSGHSYFPDGREVKIEQGQMVWQKEPNGVETYYNELGEVQRLVAGEDEYLYEIISPTDATDITVITHNSHKQWHYQDNQLIQMVQSDGTQINYNPEGAVQTITQPDGTILSEISLDEAGQLSNYIATAADQSVKQFENQRMVYFKNAQGQEHQLRYEGERVIVTLDGQESVYDQDGQLIEQLSKTDVRSVFKDGKLVRVINEEGKTVLAYNYDEQGRLQGVEFKSSRDKLNENITESQNLLNAAFDSTHHEDQNQHKR